MNLFPFQKAAEPIMPKDMSIDAYMKGVETGAQDPSVMTSVAKGISAGIDSYNNQVITQQKMQINEQVIQSQQLTLQEAQAMQQLSMEEKQLASQAKKEEYAKAIRINQQMTHLDEVLKSADAKKAAEIVFSGEYAEVLANNPPLERKIAHIAYSAFTPEQVGFLTGFTGDKVAKRKTIENKQRYTADAKALEPEVESIVSSLDFPDEERTISRLQNTTIKDARMLETDPKTGFVTGTIAMPEGSANASSFAVYDHATGQVFGYIDKEQKKAIDNHRKAVASLESIGDYEQSYSSPTQAGFRDARKEQEIQRRTTESAAAPRREAIQASRTKARTEALVKQGQPITADDYSSYLATQPILNTKGQVDLTSTPQVITAGLSAQGVPSVISSKYAEKLSGPVSDLANVRSGTSANKNKAASVAEIATTSRNMLIEEYNTLGETVGVKYTQEDVAAHNKRVDAYLASKDAGRTSGYSRDYMMQGSSPTIIAPTPLRRVETPADLYAGKNEAKLQQKIISLADQINGSVVSRRVKAARRSTLTTDIQSILGN